MEGRGDNVKFILSAKAPLIDKVVCAGCKDEVAPDSGGYMPYGSRDDRLAQGGFVFPESYGSQGKFFCGKCLPEAREAWLSALPKCGVCGKPCEKDMFLPYAFDGYKYSKRMRVCSRDCLRVRAEEEKEATEDIKRRLAEFESSVSAPECPPLFSKEPGADDAAIVLFVATLPQRWLNVFVFCVLRHIEKHPWVPTYNFTSGLFEYQYRNPEDICLEDYPHKGNSYNIKTPLPKSLWQWVSDRASDAVMKKVDRETQK